MPRTIRIHEVGGPEVMRLEEVEVPAPVHGVGGVIGTLLTGVFAAVSLGGTGFPVQTSIGAQVAVQALGVAAAVAWCVMCTWLILKLIKLFTGLRVSEEKETEGLDLAEHGERGYSP